MSNEKKTTVIHVRDAKHDFDEVYIGRGSPWGNPYIIGPDGFRHHVIEKYRKYLRENNALRMRLIELKGKTLKCFCKPLACHGDVIVELLEGEKND